MGLFDKKYCDICGQSIGLLGNRKLEDGNCCKDCAKKLSPWFSDRRRSTVEDIKRQIAYRDQNRINLGSFRATKTIETPGGYKIMINEPANTFVVSRRTDFSDNPDIIARSMVEAVAIEVKEDADEIMDKNAEGKEVSFDPPRFEYEYTFDCTIRVKLNFFDEISFEVSGTRPTDHNGEDYLELRKLCHRIRCALMPGKYREDEMVPFDTDECTCTAGETLPGAETPAADTWKCPKCGAEATGKFCNSCGTARPEPAADTWKCPNCGAEATGKFCNECGTAKPDEWFCPNCGHKSTGKFCNECGTARPVNTGWFCSNCGTRNEGKFCSKCGAARPE